MPPLAHAAKVAPALIGSPVTALEGLGVPLHTHLLERTPEDRTVAAECPDIGRARDAGAQDSSFLASLD